MVIKAREERRKKKLEKQIRRLERNERQMKPIQELEVPVAIIDHYQYVNYFQIISKLFPCIFFIFYTSYDFTVIMIIVFLQ